MSGSTGSPDGGNKKHSAQVGRAFRMIETLAGHEFDPMSTGEVAKALGVAAPVATRDLQTAEHFGWVEKTLDGLWRLKRHKMTSIALAVTHGIQRAKSRFDDEVTNYTRSIY